MLSSSFDWDEIDALIAILHAQGVCYLLSNGTSVSQEDDVVDSVQVVLRLASCGYPLVENASISLFLLRPELAPAIVQALQHAKAETAENIAVVTLATLYLQQWWFFRLTLALGRLPGFPETPFVSLWQERHLPSPDAGYGMDGLLALQAYQQQRYGIALNFLDDWQNQINHLLAQEEAHQHVLSEEVKETLVRLSK